MKTPGIILGIDTSCDDTSIAVLDGKTGRVLSNVVSSQIAAHAPHGGVVPEIASRRHSENLPAVFAQAIREAGIDWRDLEAVAVTVKPGLIGCLLVGTSFAKALATRLDRPLYAINHLEAHLFSPFIEREAVFPFLGLVVSGGHTAFYLVNGWNDITVLGQTVDDAAGEAFDKCAKMMGLGYPGGPEVDRLAQGGDDRKFPFAIPRVKLGPQYLSFSGIKTALQQHAAKHPHLDETVRADLCASLQRAVVTALMDKAEYFLSAHSCRAFAVSGGVAMNSLLRREVQKTGAKHGLEALIANGKYCTDNGAMVAHLAQFRSPEADPALVMTEPSRKIQARALWGQKKSGKILS